MRSGEERTARTGGEGRLATGGGWSGRVLEAKGAHGASVGEVQRWVSGRSRGEKSIESLAPSLTSSCDSPF